MSDVVCDCDCFLFFLSDVRRLLFTQRWPNTLTIPDEEAAGGLVSFVLKGSSEIVNRLKKIV
jgi:hypothetical protein